MKSKYKKVRLSIEEYKINNYKKIDYIYSISFRTFLIIGITILIIDNFKY